MSKKWYYTSKLGLPTNHFLVSAEYESNYIIVGEECAKELVERLNKYQIEENSWEWRWHMDNCFANECDMCQRGEKWDHLWDEEE